MPDLHSFSNAFLIGFYLGVILLTAIGTIGGPLILLWLLIRNALRVIAYVPKALALVSAISSTVTALFARVRPGTKVPTLPALRVRRKPATTTHPGSPAQ